MRITVVNSSKMTIFAQMANVRLHAQICWFDSNTNLVYMSIFAPLAKHE